MPHKETALTLADEVSDRAGAIGAANTVIFKDGRIIADNYDVVGFLTNLQATVGDQFDTDAPAVVFGAGGAARAVLHSLLEAGVPEIRLINRSRERAEALAERFGPRIAVTECNTAERAMPGASTLINTTSPGWSESRHYRLRWTGPARGLSWRILSAVLPRPHFWPRRRLAGSPPLAALACSCIRTGQVLKRGSVSVQKWKMTFGTQ